MHLRLGCNGSLSLKLALGSCLLTENGDGKLRVAESTASILVVALEQGPELFLRVIHAALFEHASELGEVNGAGVHDVEVLEHLHEASLFAHLGVRLLDQLVFQSFLESAAAQAQCENSRQSNGATYWDLIPCIFLTLSLFVFLN